MKPSIETDLLTKIRDLYAKYQRLPRKDSFAAWELEYEIEELQEQLEEYRNQP